MKLFTGRINRLSYIVIVILINGCYFLIQGNKAGLPSFVPLLVNILLVLWALSAIIKRLHDFNKSGTWLLALIVPFLNIYVIIRLILGVGDEKANRYGEAPKSGLNLL